MKNLIVLIVLVATCLAGVGWYRGWFTVTNEPAGNEKSKITVTVDKEKIHADEKKAADKAREVEHKVVDSAKKE